MDIQIDSEANSRIRPRTCFHPQVMGKILTLRQHLTGLRHIMAIIPRHSHPINRIQVTVGASQIRGERKITFPTQMHLKQKRNLHNNRLKQRLEAVRRHQEERVVRKSLLLKRLHLIEKQAGLYWIWNQTSIQAVVTVGTNLRKTSTKTNPILGIWKMNCGLI